MAFRYVRGLLGDPFGMRDNEVFAHYTFTIDVPPYPWSMDETERGDELAEWANDVIRGRVADIIQRDAQKLGVPLNLMFHNANVEVAGIGARNFDPATGQPIWKDAEMMKRWTSNRQYEGAIEDLLNLVREYGNNTMGRKYIQQGLQPKAGETKPIFLQLRAIQWRVNTANLSAMVNGDKARSFFEKHDEKRRENIVAKKFETITKNKRSEAAKRGWKTRKRRAKIEKRLRQDARKTAEKIEALMYEYLIDLAEKGNRAKRQRPAPKRRKGTARKNQATRKPQKKNNPMRRNPRPRS